MGVAGETGPQGVTGMRVRMSCLLIGIGRSLFTWALIDLFLNQHKLSKENYDKLRETGTVSKCSNVKRNVEN